MASPAKSLPANVPGDWFVDSTCIDCDTCRQLAPHVFGEADGYSFVRDQPQEAGDQRSALHALVSCPTGSIGTRGPNRAKAAMADFPLAIEGDVYYCGFASPKSFGGSSYFLRRPSGNWLIDSPKFLPQLVKKFESLGGLSHIFLTHQDDVADAEQYAQHFGARRIIHRRELSAQPDAECILDGDEPIDLAPPSSAWDSRSVSQSSDDAQQCPGLPTGTPLAPGLIAIPTPGHTAGHMVLLYANRYLFTGDHLAWDRDQHRLTAFRDYCWDSWPKQRHSMSRLLDFQFEWVLPGHGQRVHLPAGQMRAHLASLIERMGA